MENQSIPANYRQLERLDTDTLKELVRTDCFVNDLDEGAILYALHLIASREQAQNGDAGKIDDMWDRFQKEYCTSEGVGQSLYGSTASVDEAEERPVAKRRRSKVISRRIAMVAAVISILFATMVVAQASGLDIWGAIARWTDETFRFSFQGNKTTSSWMDDQEELKGSALEAVLPGWMPEGYTVEEMQLYEFQEWKRVYLSLSGENLPDFQLFIRLYETPQPMENLILEKDGTPVQERRLSNGETVYFYENEGYRGSVYQHQNIIYSISGDVMPEVVMKIFESVLGVI